MAIVTNSLITGPDNFLSGKQGYVAISNAPTSSEGIVLKYYSFRTWEMRMHAAAIRRDDITSPYQLLCVAPGIYRNTITLEGPYNAGQMPLQVGSVYIFHLGWEQVTSLELICTAQIEDIIPDNDAEGAPNIKVTAISTGPCSVEIDPIQGNYQPDPEDNPWIGPVIIDVGPGGDGNQTDFPVPISI